MDSLTHIAIGACLGDLSLDRKLGRKAMVWGALAHSLPDIDFIANFWMKPPASLLAHRGFTHSLLFTALSAIALSLAAEKWHRSHNIKWIKWLRFFAAVILFHLVLDMANNYGIGLWEPFSSERLAGNYIYVADPWFSIWPAIALVALLLLKLNHRRRVLWARIGIYFPMVYTLYAIMNKSVVDLDVRNAIRQQHIASVRQMSTPTPLNNWLWFVAVEDSGGYHIAHRSVFDGDAPMQFTYFPRNEALLAPMLDHEEITQLKKFSQGWYTVEHWGDTLVFNDLRFGQMMGWRNPEAHFAFHYFLDHGKDNRLVVQRGRFAGWNADVLHSLYLRIRGLNDAVDGSKK